MSELTRSDYWKLIRRDLDFLRGIGPRTLERDHIEHILKQSVVHEYGSLEDGKGCQCRGCGQVYGDGDWGPRENVVGP